MNEAQPPRISDVDPGLVQPAWNLAWAYRLSRALQVGQSVGLLDRLLAGPATAAELATALGLQAGPTDRLCILLAAMGVLHRETNGQYRLSRQGRDLFDPDSPTYFGDGLAHAAQGWARWDRLEASLRGEAGGPPPADPAAHGVFVRAMQDYSVTGKARWLAANVDLSGRTRLLDLGGGPGTYSMALLERWPGLRVTVWDQPQTEPHLLANLDRWGHREQVDFVAGNWNTDSFGDQEYDCALLGNVLHGEGHGCAERLAKTWQALQPGGRLVVHDFILDDDRNGPLDAAVFNVHVGAYSVSEMRDVIGAAGFVDVRFVARGGEGNGLFTAERPGQEPGR